MRLHRALPLAAAGFVMGSLLWVGPAFAQSELDRPKQLEASPRAKKMHVTEAPHSPLFIEQKDAPLASKTMMRSDSVRLFDKTKN